MLNRLAMILQLLLSSLVSNERLVHHLQSSTYLQFAFYTISTCVIAAIHAAVLVGVL